MKIDRLIGILSVLLQRDKVTTGELAERLEVSKRTINRDVETLLMAGIPLSTSTGVNGGIWIMDGYRVDRTILSGRDMQAILAGLKSLDSISGGHQYAQLMEKLSCGSADVLPGSQHILIDLGAYHKADISAKIETLQAAIEQERKARFHYASPSGETDRTIWPYYIVFEWTNWYVYGYCELRDNFRLFKLSRMTGLSVGEAHGKRAVPYPDLSRENVFPYQYHVRAVVQPEYKWHLIEEYGPDSFSTQADGTLLFSYDFTDMDSILLWALSFRDGIGLLEPEEARAELKELVQKIEAKYQ